MELDSGARQQSQTVESDRVPPCFSPEPMGEPESMESPESKGRSKLTGRLESMEEPDSMGYGFMEEKEKMIKKAEDWQNFQPGPGSNIEPVARREQWLRKGESQQESTSFEPVMPLNQQEGDKAMEKMEGILSQAS